MVLAAGLGTRLRPVTDHTPKPLLQAGGKTLLEYQLTRLEKVGVTDVVINLHHLGDQIESFVKTLDVSMSVMFSFEHEPLETGGGIRQALPMLGDDPFLVVSADTYLEGDIGSLLAPLPGGTLGRLLMTDNPAHHRQGDFSIAADGYLAQDGQCLTYTGLGLLSPELVIHEPDQSFPLRRVFDRAIAENRLLGLYHADFWWDVGTIARLESLQQRLD